MGNKMGNVFSDLEKQGFSKREIQQGIKDNWVEIREILIDGCSESLKVLEKQIKKNVPKHVEIQIAFYNLINHLKELFDIAGRIVGIGDWRPAKKGRFGKFQVINWKKAK